MVANFRKKYRQEAAAEILGVTPATLEAWRHYKKGPDYLKVGGRVYYLESDLEAFLEECQRVTQKRSKREARSNAR